MQGIVLDIKDITDSREVMESKEPPKIRWFIYFILIIIAAAIIFACCFKIDEYTKVSGEIKTLNASSSIMSSSNCKLKDILVSEGQSVRKGDVLFILDADYAKEQKGILERKLESYESDLSNTKLLKKSIEENKNLFKNDSSDSKYYYRYEQYKNGVLLSAQEIDNSQLNSSLTAEEKQNNLKTAKDDIEDKKNQLSEYKTLLSCVENGTEYRGKSELVSASYNEYYTNYKKSMLLCNQYKSSYENLLSKYDSQLSWEVVTPQQIETAKQEYDTAYSAMTTYQAAYLSDIRSQILLIENQLISDKGNKELQKALNSYTELKNSVEQGLNFMSDDIDLKNSYDNYISGFSVLADDYNTKTSEYNELYSRYSQQNNSTKVTEVNVNEAKCAYESAQLDVDVIKNTFISQLQSTINTLEGDVKTLENNQKSLELSLKGVEDLDKYEELSEEKLKNEAVITVNTELDNINENISSIESQLAEVNETIRNSEVKASYNGTVMLVDEMNEGDIVQAGNPLCSIIPNDDELKVLLYIPENEVSKIKVGQKTEYIFDAIPYNEYGKITGEITSISADSVLNESAGTKFYIAQANLSAHSLKNTDGNVREVKTGMMVEAKTISGSKKAIVWLLEKVNLMD